MTKVKVSYFKLPFLCSLSCFFRKLENWMSSFYHKKMKKLMFRVLAFLQGYHRKSKPLLYASLSERHRCHQSSSNNFAAFAVVTLWNPLQSGDTPHILPNQSKEKDQPC